MDNQPTSNTTSQNLHKKKWEKPTIEIIDIASGNFNFGPEGVPVPGTDPFFKFQQSHS
jgi:hypothetical protein